LAWADRIVPLLKQRFLNATAKLVEKLAAHKFQWITPQLHANLVASYSHLQSRHPEGMSADEWQKVELTVAELREINPER